MLYICQNLGILECKQENIGPSILLFIDILPWLWLLVKKVTKSYTIYIFYNHVVGEKRFNSYAFILHINR